MLKNNDIQEMFSNTVIFLAIIPEGKKLDKLVKCAIGCIKILKDAGEINSLIIINGNNQDKKTPLDIVMMLNRLNVMLSNEKSVNNLQLLKLAEYVKKAGGKRQIDYILEKCHNHLEIVLEETNVHEKIFKNLSKEVENLQKDSSSYVSELKKLFSTIKERKASFNNLLKIEKYYQDLEISAYKERSSISEFHLLNVSASSIIIKQKGIEKMLIDPLKHTVEQLLKEFSKDDDQINSSLISTTIEAQQQYYAIM